MADEKIVSLIDKSLNLPGVKVHRHEFLANTFAKRYNSDNLVNILEKGPYEAGVSKKELDNIAKSLIEKRTLATTSISFGTGLPGGLAMAGTIPADIIQFFGFSLRMAQELAYLYGHEDLWLQEHLDTEDARNKLILYLGAMFGVSGSNSALKFMSTGLSKELLRRLPQKALTKTFYYPIIKKTAAFLGVKITKDSFAKGVSKSVPIIGGIVSGGLTYSTMKPMGKRLQKSLSESLTITHEDFDKEYNDLKKDFPEIVNVQ